MIIGMQCQLVMCMEHQLKLTLHKRCRHCGSNNDISEFLKDWGQKPVIPLCGICDKPLWKVKQAYVSWARRRLDQQED